uniref:Uncharacterized protein n=1 Tax=Alexandrium monilatum TaxID=311494 RepID=A0A7S4RZF4_9DINO
MAGRWPSSGRTSGEARHSPAPPPTTRRSSDPGRDAGRAGRSGAATPVVPAEPAAAPSVVQAPAPTQAGWRAWGWQDSWGACPWWQKAARSWSGASWSAAATSWDRWKDSASPASSSSWSGKVSEVTRGWSGASWYTASTAFAGSAAGRRDGVQVVPEAGHQSAAPVVASAAQEVSRGKERRARSVPQAQSSRRPAAWQHEPAWGAGGWPSSATRGAWRTEDSAAWWGSSQPAAPRVQTEEPQQAAAEERGAAAGETAAAGGAARVDAASAEMEEPRHADVAASSRADGAGALAGRAAAAALDGDDGGALADEATTTTGGDAAAGWEKAPAWECMDTARWDDVRHAAKPVLNRTDDAASGDTGGVALCPADDAEATPGTGDVNWGTGQVNPCSCPVSLAFTDGACIPADVAAQQPSQAAAAGVASSEGLAELPTHDGGAAGEEQPVIANGELPGDDETDSGRAVRAGDDETDSRRAVRASVGPCGVEGFATWLREVDPAGRLSDYARVLEESYDTVDQIVRLYCGSAEEGGRLDMTFFDDVDVRDPEHQRLFSEWSARRVGTATQAPPRAGESRQAPAPPATPAEPAELPGPAELEAPARPRPAEPAGPAAAVGYAALTERAPPAEAAGAAPPRFGEVPPRDATPSGWCLGPLALFWGSHRGRRRGGRPGSEPPPKDAPAFPAPLGHERSAAALGVPDARTQAAGSTCSGGAASAAFGSADAPGSTPRSVAAGDPGCVGGSAGTELVTSMSEALDAFRAAFPSPAPRGPRRVPALPEESLGTRSALASGAPPMPGLAGPFESRGYAFRAVEGGAEGATQLAP